MMREVSNNDVSEGANNKEPAVRAEYIKWTTKQDLKLSFMEKLNLTLLLLKSSLFSQDNQHTITDTPQSCEAYVILSHWCRLRLWHVFPLSVNISQRNQIWVIGTKGCSYSSISAWDQYFRAESRRKLFVCCICGEYCALWHTHMWHRDFLLSTCGNGTIRIFFVFIHRNGTDC